MSKFVIEMADSTKQVITAAHYREADGFLHFTDELGDAVCTVGAHSVSGIERLKGLRGATATSPEEDAAPGTDAAAALLIRFWPEPAHDQPFRVRITFSQDSLNEPNTKYAHNREQVLSTVSNWLTEISAK